MGGNDVNKMWHLETWSMIIDINIKSIMIVELGSTSSPLMSKSYALRKFKQNKIIENIQDSSVRFLGSPLKRYEYSCIKKHNYQ